MKLTKTLILNRGNAYKGVYSSKIMLKIQRMAKSKIKIIHCPPDYFGGDL